MTGLLALNEIVRMNLSQLRASILTTSSQITHLVLDNFRLSEDKAEGAEVLSALVSSTSLPTITHFRCHELFTWFSEGKESNVELLSDAIRAMTNLKYLNLSKSNFSTEAMCDKVSSAIVENQESNRNLLDINFFEAGYSATTEEHIAALTAKGLTVAENGEQQEEMHKRYHPEEKPL